MTTDGAKVKLLLLIFINNIRRYVEKMIRRIESADRADYIKFAKEFYTSDAVTHDVPEEYLTLTFETLVEGNPFSDGYMIESDGENVGYALVAKTFSQEAGGMVAWFEELYLSEKARGKGLGTLALMYLEGKYVSEGYKRIRLEYTAENERAAKLYRHLGFKTLDYLQMLKAFK